VTFETLIDVGELARRIAEGEVVVCDCRFDLADVQAGRRAYIEGHIPGAVYVDLDHDLSAEPNGHNGRHPLPDPQAFAARMAELGLSKSRQVVSYDSSGGYYASRLWWMLRWIGHKEAAVLDGGFAAWVAGGHPLRQGEEQTVSGAFEAPDGPQMPISDVRAVEANLDSGKLLVVDARTAERFAGEPHPLDTASGHIPGAGNRFWGKNLDADGRFKPADQLAREFSELLGGRPAGEVVHQCGSGVTATHNLLAMEVAGLGGSRLYPGSWSEWTSDPKRPVAKGG
jgi:thiosulfate/3-mercaptopyruvate sulfurtransferase